MMRSDLNANTFLSERGFSGRISKDCRSPPIARRVAMFHKVPMLSVLYAGRTPGLSNASHERTVPLSR